MKGDCKAPLVKETDVPPEVAARVRLPEIPVGEEAEILENSSYLATKFGDFMSCKLTKIFACDDDGASCWSFLTKTKA